MSTTKGGVLVVDHPVVADRLRRLRDRNTTPPLFRQAVAQLSALVAYEALRELETEPVVIDTPVATGVTVLELCENVLLVPILRAGLGMIPPVQELLVHSDVAHIGLRRDEATLVPEVYLNRLPADLSTRRVVVCDPMLATGGSLVEACDLVKRHGATRVSALCLIASRPGLARVRAAHPDVPIACAAIDPDLDERGFIMPGLGDAGDRLFGPPT